VASYFYGNFSFQASDLFRNRGRYTTLQAEAYQANIRLAERLQRAVASELKTGLVRPRVSTGRLEKVMLDGQNRVVANEGFGVGIPGYLDKSQGKYYRQIDAGTDIHLGQKLHGLWSNSKRLKSLNPYDRSGAAPRGATAFGAGAGQEFFPVRGRDAIAALKKGGMSRTQAKRRTKGIIRRAIEPEDYFQRAWTAFDAPASIFREYDRLFRAAGFQVYWANGQLTKRAIGGGAAEGRRQIRGA
jgi:hypothetical protein